MREQPAHLGFDPGFGAFIHRFGLFALDRNHRADADDDLARALDEGVALPELAGVPVVPVAHNAGEFWKRNAFIKRPGEIIVSIGPVIEVKGVKANDVSEQAEAWIEGEMRRLDPAAYPAALPDRSSTPAA